MRRVGLILIAVAVALTAQAPLSAQTDGDHFGIFNFRAQNPGARARGLGGAFVALADDATAAYINPAGLAYLDRWEISAEYSHDEEKRLVAQNSYGNYRAEVSSEDEFLSFASAVFPIKKGRLTAAVFYANSSPLGESNVTGVFIPEYDSDQTGTYWPSVIPVAWVENEVFGASLGLRINDQLSIGGSIGQSTLNFYGQTIFEDPNIAPYSYVSDESDYFATVGVLYQFTDRFGMGFSWQKETKYDMFYFGDGVYAQSGSTTFTIPTRWALGMSFRATDSLVFSLEADLIEYSDLFKKMEGATYFGDLFGSDYGFTSNDVIEYHLGAEYTFFAGSVGWSLRGGYWRDEEHLPYYTGNDAFFQGRQPERDEKIDHFTAGFGVAFKHFMLDFAGDYSDYAGTDYLGSVVFRF